MLHLGRVIEVKRKQAKLSREALSKGICSKEYIYLVEKGKRSPSIEITKALGDKLNVDFESYLNYLDAEEPILVKEVIQEFVDLRQKYDFKELGQRTKYAEKQKDFMQAPYKYEVIFNKIVLNHMNQKDFDQTVALISRSINDLGGSMAFADTSVEECSEILMRFYSLLASIYHYEDRTEEEGKLLEVLYNKISIKKDQQSFYILYITILMSYANFLYKSAYYTKALKIVNEIIFFQNRKHYLGKMHMSYYLLHLIQKEMGVESQESYDKALHLAKGFDREKDFLIITDHKYC